VDAAAQHLFVIHERALALLRTHPTSTVRFAGPKLSSAIRIRSRLHRDALIQFSLDPAVRSVGFVGTTQFKEEPVVIDATTVNRDGRRYYLDLVEDFEPQDHRLGGLAILAMHDLGFTPLEKTAADILADPPHANCRTIWKHARDRVATADQFDVIQILQDDGPQRLGRLAPAARVSEQAILSMACSDLVEIDIYDGPLSARTMIRRRDRVRLSPPQVIAVAI
jgi:hypothetical protein